MDKKTILNRFIGHFLNSWGRLFFSCVVLIVLNMGCSIFDLTPPRVNIVMPEDQSRVGWDISLVGSVAEKNLDRIEIYLDDNKIREQKENEFNFIVYFPSLGAHTLKVKAYDKGGNWDEIILHLQVVSP